MNLILLDADVIIDLHRLGAWQQVVTRKTIRIPSIIAQEAYYYEDQDFEKHPIGLQQQIAEGAVKEIAVSASDLAVFTQKFDPVFQGEIHAGEKEALRILEDDPEMEFCTCDKVAIKALALLGRSEQGICVESLLKQSGLTKTLETKHTEIYFKKWLGQGQIMRIQGQGLQR